VALIGGGDKKKGKRGGGNSLCDSASAPRGREKRKSRSQGPGQRERRKKDAHRGTRRKRRDFSFNTFEKRKKKDTDVIELKEPHIPRLERGGKGKRKTSPLRKKKEDSSPGKQVFRKEKKRGGREENGTSRPLFHSQPLEGRGEESVGGGGGGKAIQCESFITGSRGEKGKTVRQIPGSERERKVVLNPPERKGEKKEKKTAFFLPPRKGGHQVFFQGRERRGSPAFLARRKGKLESDPGNRGGGKEKGGSIAVKK